MCSVPGCASPVLAKGLCKAHYQRVKRYGDVNANHNISVKGQICSVDSCDRPVEGKGLCSMHAKRMRRHGSPNTVSLTVNKGNICKAEGCTSESFSKGYCSIHYARVFRYGRETVYMRPRGEGFLTKDGYRMLCLEDGTHILEHVFLAEKALGRKLPEGAVVHHMNEDRLDNFTPLNLILCPNQGYHLLLHRRMRDAGYANSTIYLQQNSDEVPL